MNKSKNKKWRHVMVSPFLRYYNKVKCPRRCESLCRDSMLANCCRQDSLLGRCCRRDSICCDSLMACSYLRDSLRRRSFWSIHGVYSHYNVSGVRFPLGLYPSVRDSRRQGDFVAIGGSYGYSWRLSRHFFLEAELGLAVGYTWYKEYDCATCGAYRGRDCKFFLLPKLGLNLVWNLGRKGRNGEISAKN